MTWYTIAWIGWLAYFVIAETCAVLDRRKGDTLTEHVKKWASMYGQGRAWRIRRFALLALIAWIAGHFLTPGWF